MHRLLKRINEDPDLRDSVRHCEALPERPARFAEPAPPLPDPLLQGLKRLGIEQLFSHQVEAIQEIRAGANTVVVTPTASGKTLTYFLPLAESLLKDPSGHALLIFPLKALEQDQLRKIQQWAEWLKKDLNLSAEIYDGDTPKDLRAKIKRRPPRILITNPDMLHQAILAYHQGWDKLLRNLRYVVLDELHAYRGVFGSHILQVFRRLSRLFVYYDVNPQFICLSATIANPLQLAEGLTGREFKLISESGSPTAEKNFYLINPTASVTSTVAKLFVHAIDSGLKTIAFTKARVTTEIIYRTVREMRPELAEKVTSYRAGFMPEERREIERKLSSGELHGVISTSALELGIDIGGLDLCILAGYPGSIMSTWQRAGRVGRRGEKSAIMLVAGSDALDQYLLANPHELFQRDCEAALINDSNEEILRQHLPSAAAEIPLMKTDPYIDVAKYGSVIAELEHEGQLVRSASGRQWFPGRNRPQSRVNLRNVGGTFDIILHDCSSEESIGQISGGPVFRECHDGAVYLHRGEQYKVVQLNLEKKQVEVEPFRSPVYTMVRSDKQTEIIDVRWEKTVKSFVVRQGKVRVTEDFHSYERRRIYTQELLSVEPLELPPQSYVTNSTWIELPETLGERLKEAELHHMGGIHAIEHAAISLIPLFALCDRNDIGGISFTKHKQIENGAIFFYDGYPGGAGIAEYVYEVIEKLLKQTLLLIENCKCEEGCPSCIHSPKCGAGNKPLDKAASIAALKLLLATPRTVPEIRPVELITANVKEETPSVPDWVPLTIPENKRVVVFDLETQLSADEVGGWNQARQMRVATGVVWDSRADEFFVYDESQTEELIEHLKRADLVVGYNCMRFDYEVLRGYTFENLRLLPTLDLLDVVTKARGGRLKLDSLGKATFGLGKTADGLQSLQWFKEGKLDLIIEYCKQDVALTRDLLLFALKNGYLFYSHRQGENVKLPVRINLNEFWNESLEALS
ncbi:DEAD/DEAH box helicase, partial [bacterium]|nr:DEAD/DEAH box helicase [bacterium]